MNIQILGSNFGISSYAGFTSWVMCKTADEAAIDAGTLIWDQQLTDQYKYLMNHASAPLSDRGWLRNMDNSGVQNSWETDFANRMPVTAMTTSLRDGCPYHSALPYAHAKW